MQRLQNLLTKIKIRIIPYFDFSRELSFREKCWNIAITLGVSAIWVIVMVIFMFGILGLAAKDLQNAIQATITFKLADQLRADEDWLLIFFLACIMAPLWEECVFRYSVIKFGQTLDQLKVIWGASTLLPLILTSSIIFGILHGSVINILIQGFLGAAFCWLYLKNNNSYWSVVAAHAIWNFLAIFGYQWFSG